ncbi:MAG: hypothetical protein AAFR98_03110 [Pseudomonadota bacterium]
MLDKPGKTFEDTTKAPVVPVAAPNYKQLAKRYAGLLENVSDPTTPQEALANSSKEIWNLGTHVPPKYKEPVQDGDAGASLTTSIEVFSEKTQIYKRTVKVTAQLMLIAALSYMAVDLLLIFF